MHAPDFTPKVFVSAVSADLRTLRIAVSRALTAAPLHCLPIEQNGFPTNTFAAVRGQLKAKIADCDAVVHFVGRRYGYEPDFASLPPGAERRSYTQLEFDLAQELKKPLYVFVCDDDFPYDPPRPGTDPPEEPAELQALQQAHRARFVGTDEYVHTVHTPEEVTATLTKLNVKIDQLREALRRAAEQAQHERNEIKGGITTLGTQIGDVNAKLELLTRAVTAMSQPQLPPAAAQTDRDRIAAMSDDDYFAELGRRTSLPVGTIHAILHQGRQSLDLSVQAEAALLDRRYADAERLFAEAGRQKLLQAAPLMESIAKDELGRAKALYYQQQFDDAVEILTRAHRLLADLPTEPNASHRELDSEIQFWIARTHQDRLIGLAGIERRACLEATVTAYRAALEVYTRDAAPTYWAATQNNLANALRDQAGLEAGTRRAELLAQAVTAYRAALEVSTRNAAPTYWATTQNNLANALSDQAGLKAGTRRAELLAQAVTAYRAALEVYTRDADPTYWAMTQNNLASTLGDQAGLEAGTHRAELLAEAVTAFRAALEIRTRAAAPTAWAMTQNNLATTLYDQAGLEAGPRRAELLAEAVTAFRAALEVYTRDSAPTYWATIQNNLANALRDQAWLEAETRRAELLTQAVTAYHAALEVRTRNAAPTNWATTQNNLANVLSDQAGLEAGTRRAELLAQAVTAYRAALEIYTRDAAPTDWAMTQRNLLLTLQRQAESAAPAERAAIEAEIERITCALKDSGL